MSNSVQPHRRQPTRLPCPWDSPGKNTGVDCHSLLQCVKVKSLSRIRLLATPWTASNQAPPSMGFSRQEYWSGVPLPPPNRMPYYLSYYLSNILATVYVGKKCFDYLFTFKYKNYFETSFCKENRIIIQISL